MSVLITFNAHRRPIAPKIRRNPLVRDRSLIKDDIRGTQTAFSRKPMCREEFLAGGDRQHRVMKDDLRQARDGGGE
jgi:hypothetical protein